VLQLPYTVEEGGKLGGFVVKPKLEWKEMLVLLKDKVEASASRPHSAMLCQLNCPSYTVSVPLEDLICNRYFEIFYKGGCRCTLEYAKSELSGDVRQASGSPRAETASFATQREVNPISSRQVTVELSLSECFGLEASRVRPPPQHHLHSLCLFPTLTFFSFSSVPNCLFLLI